MLPGEAELVSERAGLSGRAKSIKRFERSNELDTALYKNYLFLHTDPKMFFVLHNVISVQYYACISPVF